MPGGRSLRGRLLPTAIKFPDFSVNREKYSGPRDLLIPPWLAWGVAAFTVADVPPSLCNSEGTEFQFAVEHDPMGDNFAHSAVRCYRAMPNVGRVCREPSNTVKVEFRILLSEATRVIIEPAE